MSDTSPRSELRRNLILLAIYAITAGLVFAIIVWVPAFSTSIVDLRVGDVASQDITAPNALSYISEVLTSQQEEIASSAIFPQYTTSDTSVARAQLENLRAALAYISSVRADTLAADEQRLADLAALQDLYLSQEIGLNILSLSDSRWQAVHQEAINVLEQVMRSTIREDRVESVRAGVPSLVSLSFPEDQALIVSELAAALVAPNSFYSESLTEAARLDAVNSIEPVTLAFASGETILERGEVVSAVDVEALQHMGLALPQNRWQDLVSVGTLVFLSVALAGIFLSREARQKVNLRSLILLLILFLSFLLIARLILPIHNMAPFVFPIAAYALILAGLLGEKPALVSMIPLIMLATYQHPNAAELVLYYGIGSLFGVLVPKREQRISSYLWVAITIAASGSAVLITARLPQVATTWGDIAILSSLAVLNGVVAAGVTVLMQYFLAPVLGKITPLQLLELSRPDSFLLEYLLRNAPGTYQHSLQVANLSEQAAERIGADSLLTRVGALYHDIGKATNAHFFIENQTAGFVDTHDDISQTETAATIIKHVTDGLELAREYRLPIRIQDFIAEHHGTLKTLYQFSKAVKDANGDKSLVDESLFQYPGPRPQSRETALVMLADSCEARIRAQQPKTENELREMIKDTIDSRVQKGQLDDTAFSLLELRIVKESYEAGLRGIHHPRVEYPSDDTP
ncbi:MAG: HDIG domain-containing protein, partial [Anaerolineae bacterium]|nr:HDIG domain-containing protein [Anaerolineae bacterium]